ncbi:MAG: isoleucine--tRNA ligase, partial [SAR202 cluster bacterium]|nr:isoleucine--tRNA ligase [SAR202 cluster bacterium]
EDDLALARRENLPLVHTVDPRGEVTASLPEFAGLFVKRADPLITRDLKRRGLLFKEGRLRHTYPFCWRCDSPLLYYAKSSWYIKTTAKKERLLSANAEINWYPEHIKNGRFGEWLRNNVDWALSRERYWGTPLPVWECSGCGRQECIGSRAELAARPGLAGFSPDMDLHRPFIDGVTFSCDRCGARMKRLPDLIDVWFDSGAMPLGQWHYPFDNRELIDSGQWLPADYICEAVDQTRGWFYTLHALAVLLFDKPAYRNVICLGLVLDAKGEKMSKSKGNIVEPAAVIQAHGADALRWYLFTSSPPGNARRFSTELVGDVVRRFLLTLWNTYAFFVTYANLDRWTPGAAARGEQPELAELDRWALSELNLLVREVTAALDGYDPTTAGRRIEEFVETLSTWYVRRSRRRFWKSEDDADKQAAYLTLYSCLVTLAKLMAPLAPFTAEAMYQNLVRAVDELSPESVHMSDWPRVDESLIDSSLSAQVGLAMKVVGLGRAARQQAQLKVRQPLAEALVRATSPAEQQALERLEDQVKEELNVKRLRVLSDAREVAVFDVRPNLPVLGPKYGRDVGKIGAALRSLDPAAVASQVQAGRAVAAGQFTLEASEVLVQVSPAPGFALATEGPYLVAVSTDLTDELIDEGLARELVHAVQNLRRDAGFEIADRIITYWQGDEAVRRAVERHRAYIAQETLSQMLQEGPPEAGAFSRTVAAGKHQVLLGVRRL